MRQGFNGDCWFLSAVCAISNKKNLINRICVARDETVGVYGFVFHRDGDWFFTVIDDKLYLTAADWWECHPDEKATFLNVSGQEGEATYRETFQTGSKALYFAQCREENETWLPLLEKAYAKAHGDYSAIDGGFTGEAIEDLTGGVTTELFATDILDKERFWNEEIKQVNKEFLFSCSTGTFDKWQDSDTASQNGARAGIIRMHAYSIMDAVERKGQRLLKVRNPWGSDEWRGAWSDGSEQWTVEWMKELNHKFGDDGMFWISYDDVLQKYSEFERTRLFDESWTITQQWTTVDVPWSADYNDTKFTITLTKAGPIVIVLSQLDRRYFKGMEGQYTFQLHFRLDKDGEDDYIVRSHGNYSMTRSVSTDLELDPGTYSVLMRITAKREVALNTPVDILETSCTSRPNKLIQTGLSYDLAHAKGDIIETEEDKESQQKHAKQKKVSKRGEQRKQLSEKQKSTWTINRRIKARDKRRAQRREEHQRKKAEKQKAVKKVEAPSKPTEGLSQSNNTADQNKVDEANVKGAEVIQREDEPNGKVDEVVNKVEKVSLESGDDNLEAKNGDLKKSQPSLREDAEGPKVKLSEAAEKPKETAKADGEADNVPSVMVNGDAPPDTQPGSMLAPPSAEGSISGADDDYLYDSDASFHSSIDSVLDFPEESSSDKEGGNAADDIPANEADDEPSTDPWNAVCVVGLRVYSKDESCRIKIVRPRAEQGGEEVGLEVDDVSKDVSEEKDEHVKVGQKQDIKTEVAVGVGA